MAFSLCGILAGITIICFSFNIYVSFPIVISACLSIIIETSSFSSVCKVRSEPDLKEIKVKETEETNVAETKEEKKAAKKAAKAQKKAEKAEAPKGNE